MSEPTQQQKCADLARKMNIPESEWPYKCFAEKHQMDNDGGNAWCYTCEMMADNSERVPPNPYESAADKDALVAWLAADDARWFVFIRKLIKLINWPSQSRQEMTDATFPKIVSEVKHLMTAPREIMADAAWVAIQEPTDTRTSQPSL